MAPKKSLTSVSLDTRVTQYLFWDKDTSQIEVSHSMNLGSGEKVYRESIITYKPGEKDYDKWAKWGINDGENITVYLYRLTDGGPDNDHNVLFPENGTHYPLDTLPHTVIACIQEGGDPSTANGVAL